MLALGPGWRHSRRHQLVAAWPVWSAEMVHSFAATDTEWQVPGKTLPPGAYILKLLDMRSTRTVVQILSADEKVLAIIIAVPVYNWTRRQKTEFIFGEVKPGEPRPLQAWLFPGNTGLEFMYPGNR